MTLLRRPPVPGDDPDRLVVEFSRLPCDYGPSASRRAGAGKSRGSRVLDGWIAPGMDAASRMRQ